ncbi:MAG: hypothetical protein JWQ96_3340 [Segetibacter sp.]|nr:hypothetical protein [Segetibacter sp.]
MFKKLTLTFFTCFTFFCLQAQFYKSILPSPEFNNMLEKVVSDFRYNFKNIIGDTLVSEGEAESFKSTAILPGSIDCVIYKFHSVRDTTASYQSTMYNGEDYKDAVKAYKNTFRLMNKSRLQLVDKSVLSFSGKLEEPAENLRFTVSSLQLDSQDDRYSRFRAEVELVSTYDGWKVSLNLHNTKPDEDRE